MAKQITPEQLAKSSESSQQSALFCWAAQSGIPELKRMFHVPNGGSRHIAEAAKLKAMGVKAGVPDIFLPVITARFNGLWIELKNAKGVVSKEQQEWLEYLASQCYATRVCFEWKEAKQAILEYLGR